MAKKGTGRCLAWEVSAVNDDLTDNYFLEPLGKVCGGARRC